MGWMKQPVSTKISIIVPMCGIVGYVGRKQALNIALAALERMEYRGYDSAGIAVLDGRGAINIEKKSRKAG